jgi:hypothetical protein
MSTETDLLRLTHADVAYAKVADTLVRNVRRGMSVPEQADADVELEFAAFRTHLDQFLPEFGELFAKLLLPRLGAEQLPEVLAALASPPAQAYLRVAPLIEQRLQPIFEELNAQMQSCVDALLQAEGNPSAPLPAGAAT